MRRQAKGKLRGLTAEENMERERKESRNEGTARRKPYTKPSFVSEKIYETVALACSKLPGQGGFCNAAPRRS